MTTNPMYHGPHQQSATVGSFLAVIFFFYFSADLFVSGGGGGDIFFLSFCLHQRIQLTFMHPFFTHTHSHTHTHTHTHTHIHTRTHMNTQTPHSRANTMTSADEPAILEQRTLVTNNGYAVPEVTSTTTNQSSYDYPAAVSSQQYKTLTLTPSASSSSSSSSYGNSKDLSAPAEYKVLTLTAGNVYDHAHMPPAHLQPEYESPGAATEEYHVLTVQEQYEVPNSTASATTTSTTTTTTITPASNAHHSLAKGNSSSSGPTSASYNVLDLRTRPADYSVLTLRGENAIYADDKISPTSGAYDGVLSIRPPTESNNVYEPTDHQGNYQTLTSAADEYNSALSASATVVNQSSV